jgi:hypothetical protein
MKQQLAIIVLFFGFSCSVFGQEVRVGGAEQIPAGISAPVTAPVVDCPRSNESDGSGFLTGDRAFPNFIGWVSNPTKTIDPRALTQLWPVFASTWTDSSIGALPSGNVQLYGAGISIALTERLEFGLNNGGYAVSHFDKDREGWLNLGGFVQYTLIRDIPDQFIVSGGLSWVFPWGESDVFAGHGPTTMSTYLTAGKEFGNFHVLTTNGFKYPISPGKNEATLFYGSLHIDRRTCGWIYPLVEFNYGSSVTSPELDIPVPHDFLNMGGVNPSIGMLTVAPGVNFVLIPNHLEVGAVYQTPIAAEHDFRFNEVLVKMILRY